MRINDEYEKKLSELKRICEERGRTVNVWKDGTFQTGPYRASDDSYYWQPDDIDKAIEYERGYIRLPLGRIKKKSLKL